MNSSLTWVRSAKIARTVVYYVAFIALGLISASLGPTLLGLAENTGSTLAQISYSFTARSLGYLIGSSQGGRAYDRWRGHPIQAMALLVIALMFCVAPLATRLWLLIAIWLITGLAEGTLDVGTNTLLVWVHKDKVGPFMNGLHFFFGMGAFLAPIIVAQVMMRGGSVRWVYWMIALLVSPVSILLFRLPSPPIAGAQEDAAPERRVSAALVVCIALFFFLAVGIEIGLSGWLYTYALEMGIANETTAAYLNSAFWGAFTAGRLLAIPLAARLRPRTILIGDLLLCLVSMLVLVFLPGSPLVVWIGVMGAGLAIAPMFATTMSLAERLMPISGKVTGYFFIGVSSGSLVMPWLIGQLIEPIGPRAMMVTILVDVVLALLVLAALLFFFSDGHTRPKGDPGASARGI